MAKKKESPKKKFNQTFKCPCCKKGITVHMRSLQHKYVTAVKEHPLKDVTDIHLFLDTLKETQCTHCKKKLTFFINLKTGEVTDLIEKPNTKGKRKPVELFIVLAVISSIE